MAGLADDDPYATASDRKKTAKRPPLTSVLTLDPFYFPAELFSDADQRCAHRLPPSLLGRSVLASWARCRCMPNPWNVERERVSAMRRASAKAASSKTFASASTTADAGTRSCHSQSNTARRLCKVCNELMPAVLVSLTSCSLQAPKHLVQSQPFQEPFPPLAGGDVLDLLSKLEDIEDSSARQKRARTGGGDAADSGGERGAEKAEADAEEEEEEEEEAPEDDEDADGQVEGDDYLVVRPCLLTSVFMSAISQHSLEKGVRLNR